MRMAEIGFLISGSECLFTGGSSHPVVKLSGNAKAIMSRGKNMIKVFRILPLNTLILPNGWMWLRRLVWNILFSPPNIMTASACGIQSSHPTM